MKLGILTKNFVTLKDGMGLRMAEAVGHKKLIYRMKLPKNVGGRLGQFLDLR